MLFQLNPPCRVGEIILDDEIPFGDEIRLDAGWVDLISSKQQFGFHLRKQISSLHQQGFHYKCRKIIFSEAENHWYY